MTDDVVAKSELVGRQKERAAIIAWLENTNFDCSDLEGAAEFFAERISRLAHLNEGDK